MKTISLLAIITFCFSANLMADSIPKNQTTSPTCREQVSQEQSFDSLREQVKQDLLEGVWTEILDLTALTQGKKRIFKFKEIGTVEIVSIFEDGHSEQEFQVWRIAEKEGIVKLELTDMSSDNTRVFQLTQTCDGMTLKDELLDIEYVWVYQSGKLGDQLHSGLGLPIEVSVK